MSMVWRNERLSLYHGTVGSFANDIVANGIDLSRCQYGRDFGRGFYMTRRETEAIRFANEKYGKLKSQAQQIDPECAAVVHFAIDRNDLAQLDTLVFISTDLEWEEFVYHCRTCDPSEDGHKGPGAYYDAVHGLWNRPAWTQGQRRGRRRLGGGFEVTNASALRLDQVSFHSTRAASALVRVNLVRGVPMLG
jgi:hypothetical protein